MKKSKGICNFYPVRPAGRILAVEKDGEEVIDVQEDDVYDDDIESSLT